MNFDPELKAEFQRLPMPPLLKPLHRESPEILTLPSPQQSPKIRLRSVRVSKPVHRRNSPSLELFPRNNLIQS